MAKNGVSLALYNGSDLGGMERPPEGVQDLMEEWFETAGLTAPLKYRIKTRDPGAPHTKRVTPRGVHDGNFIYARVKPDSGGNGNCWVVWITVERGLNTQGVNVALDRAAATVNDRTVERKTPTPAAPPDPYAELGLAELKSRAEALKVKREEAGGRRIAANTACESQRARVSEHKASVTEIETKLTVAKASLEGSQSILRDNQRELDTVTQECSTIDKDLGLIEAALARRQEALADEAVGPIHDLIRQEAERLGIPVDVCYARLRAAS